MEEMPSMPVTPAVVLSPEKDAQENKMITAVGYVGLLFLIPMLLAKDSPFAQFHAKQGLVLFGLEVATGILGTVLTMLLVTSSRGYGLSASYFTFSSLISVLNFLWLILSIVGIIKVFSGEKWELPILGKWAASLKI